mgnify:CR=1 FL=1
MELILFRHGIAIDREDPDCPGEEERFLTEKGIARSHAAARGLARLGVAPDRIVSSPLLRARQTALIAAEELGIDPGTVEEWPELAYWIDPAATLRRLSRLRDGQVLLAGHRPHLDELLAAALGWENAAVTTLKKAGAACVDWFPPAGELRWLLTPRALRDLGSLS